MAGGRHRLTHPGAPPGPPRTAIRSPRAAPGDAPSGVGALVASEPADGSSGAGGGAPLSRSLCSPASRSPHGPHSCGRAQATSGSFAGSPACPAPQAPQVPGAARTGWTASSRMSQARSPRAAADPGGLAGGLSIRRPSPLSGPLGPLGALQGAKHCALRGLGRSAPLSTVSGRPRGRACPRVTS